jgi:ParB-like chromosome segregation protein Spo0J
MSAVRKTLAIGEPGWRPTEVHPLAALFPMMTDDELADLAADIETHGLLHNIVIDDVGKLLDGRNRLRACEIANVEPMFEQLNGVDAAAYIVSANLARRNLTKGQQAMALAMIYPQPKRGRGRKDDAHKGAETASFSYRRVQEARVVLHHSLALAEDVIAARTSLDAALKTVEEAREVSANIEATLDELRRNAPDLADLVVEERLTVNEAHSAFKKRQADAIAAEANKREIMLRLSETAWQSTTAWAAPDFVAAISERLQDKDFRRSWLARMRFDPDRLDDVRAGATALATLLANLTKEGNDV